MLYDVANLSPEEKVLDAFPALMHYPGFAEYGSGENDHWARFVIYYCDKASPYAHLLTEQRLIACIDAAGIPSDDPYRESVLLWESESIGEMAYRLMAPHPPLSLEPTEGVLKMAVGYIKLQSPLTFQAYSLARKLAFEVAELASSPINEANNSKLSKLTNRLELANQSVATAITIDEQGNRWCLEQQARERRKTIRAAGLTLPAVNVNIEPASEWVGVLSNLEECKPEGVATQDVIFKNGFTEEHADIIAEKVGIIRGGRYALGVQKKSAVTGFFEGLKMAGVLSYTTIPAAQHFFGQRYSVVDKTDRETDTRGFYRTKTLNGARSFMKAKGRSK